ncbi:MAG: DNA (cytosine-5-)-methyltransferase [Cyanobacteriota bacterium]
MKFIDLFAGIGGFRLGFENANFECVFSSEIDEHAKKMYFENFNDMPYSDITKIDEKNIPEHNILLAGFPCQPFSISGKKLGFEDTRGNLFFEIIRIIKEKQPEIIVLENVKHFKNHDKGRTLKIVLKSLEDLGYTTSWKVLNAKDFGVPQNRERTIIIGNRNGLKFNFNKLVKNQKLSIESILDIENSNFEYLEENEYTLIENYKKQESGLIFVGYRNKKIRQKGTKANTEHLSRVHKQPNRIYSSKGTHPTLASQETAGRYFIYHNGRVRKITINECFKLMGFPETFKLVGTKGNLYNRIGNSIVVSMVEEIARNIRLQFLENNNKEHDIFFELENGQLCMNL